MLLEDENTCVIYLKEFNFNYRKNPQLFILSPIRLEIGVELPTTRVTFSLAGEVSDSSPLLHLNASADHVSH